MPKCYGCPRLPTGKCLRRSFITTVVPPPPPPPACGRPKKPGLDRVKVLIVTEILLSGKRKSGEKKVGEKLSRGKI